MTMGSKQIKIGAVLYYFTIAFNMIAGLIYTPWMIEKIGQGNYGLFTLATSLINLFVIDFGISAAVSRSVAKYNAEKDQEKVNNFLGVVYKLYMMISTVIFIVLLAVGFFLEEIYANLSPSELGTFKILYAVSGLFTVVSFPFISLNGILTAYEKFIGLRMADFIHKALVIVSMVILLSLGYGVFALVTVNAIAGLLVIAIKLFYIKNKTPVRVNFKYWHKDMLKEVSSFSLWTMIISLAQRLIFNITPSVIAMFSTTGAVGVSIFGLASTIEGYIYTFATALNGMFITRITNIVHSGKKDTELMPLMIKIGRLQCMIIGLLCVGFVALGKSFIIDIWNKPNFSESYLCAVILILPSFFYLPMEIANTTLIVENKVKFQAIVFIIMGMINLTLSVILSKFYGAIGASVSIFISYMVRNILMMVIYKKALKLDMTKFFKETYLKLLPQLLLTLIISFAFSHYNSMNNCYTKFLLDGIVLVAAYFIIMWIKGFNTYERMLFRIVLSKTKK